MNFLRPNFLCLIIVIVRYYVDMKDTSLFSLLYVVLQYDYIRIYSFIFILEEYIVLAFSYTIYCFKIYELVVYMCAHVYVYMCAYAYPIYIIVELLTHGVHILTICKYFQILIQSNISVLTNSCNAREFHEFHILAKT